MCVSQPYVCPVCKKLNKDWNDCCEHADTELIKKANEYDRIMKECKPIKTVDLVYLSEFRCEHHSGASDEDNCFKHSEQGGCCNSCWVRNWAEQQLKREK